MPFNRFAKLSKSATPYILGVAAVASWMGSSKYLRSQIDVSSHLMKQTLFNLSQDPNVLSQFGKHLSVTSDIDGEMLQRKGIADLTFEVTGSIGNTGIVHVTATRERRDWKTNSLTIFDKNQNVNLTVLPVTTSS